MPACSYRAPETDMAKEKDHITDQEALAYHKVG